MTQGDTGCSRAWQGAEREAEAERETEAERMAESDWQPAGHNRAQQGAARRSSSRARQGAAGRGRAQQGAAGRGRAQQGAARRSREPPGATGRSWIAAERGKRASGRRRAQRGDA